MADEFDPLKQPTNKPTEDLYARPRKTSTNHNDDDDLLRPQFENILKTGHNQTNTSTGQQSQDEVYHKLNFMNNASKVPVRSTNPFNEEVQKSSPSTDVIHQLPQGEIKTATTTTAATTATTITSKPPTEPYYENPESYHGQDYEPGPPPAYYPEEYYEDQPPYKKKGFSATIDRLVQRFPVLGIFYKQPPSVSAEVYATEQQHEYAEENDECDQAPQLVDANQSSRELTADELALNERYSNKLRTQIIRLQIKDQTQPVDVRIHHDSYTLYSCDVGRSVVEIFDMYGKLQYVIDDQATIKFQPTAIAVAYDGTIIVASHFNHCLHMYSPIDLQENEHKDQNESFYDGYHFKQYKLGSPGHNLHQFHYPAGIAIDFNDGYLYVCDRGNFRIQVMRPEGVCERVIELMLHDQEQSRIAPIQIAHQQNGDQLVCILDTGDSLCFLPKYADGPTYIEPFYILDNDGLGLQGASGLAIDSNNRIFISDTGHHRIVICTPEGGYITHFGVEGDGPGELKRPCGLDITIDGTIVIADSGNKRLQLFGSIREQTMEDKKSSTEKSEDKNNSLINMESAAT